MGNTSFNILVWAQSLNLKEKRHEAAVFKTLLGWEVERVRDAVIRWKNQGAKPTMGLAELKSLLTYDNRAQEKQQRRWNQQQQHQQALEEDASTRGTRLATQVAEDTAIRIERDTKFRHLFACLAGREEKESSIADVPRNANEGGTGGGSLINSTTTTAACSERSSVINSIRWQNGDKNNVETMVHASRSAPTPIAVPLAGATGATGATATTPTNAMTTSEPLGLSIVVPVTADVMPVLAILCMASRTTYTSKLSVLFSLCDADGDGLADNKEVGQLYSALVMAASLLAGSVGPFNEQNVSDGWR
jgi:hypothetical protein